MSNFILNLAQRGAGLAPIMALQPALPSGYSPAIEAPAEMPMQHTLELLEAPMTGLGEHVLAQPKVETAPGARRVPPSMVRPGDTAPQGAPEAGIAPRSELDRLDSRLAGTPGMTHLPATQSELETQRPRTAIIRSQTPSSAPVSNPNPLLPVPEAPTPALARVEPAAQVARQDLPMIRPAPIHSSTFTASDKSTDTSTESRAIQVRIGTIEVRATTPPAPAPPRAPTPQGFDDYAPVRTYLTWGQY